MKPFMKQSILLIVVAVSGFLFFNSCTKNNESTTVHVRLTDNPYNAEEVNVDIEEVRVKFRDGESNWMTFDTHAGIYNLLGLQNGVDTLLAVGTIPSNVVKEIRFILGSENSIKIGGVVYPLTIPSGSESGLKIKVDKKLNGTLDSLLIDFDAALSIVQEGNGDYHLKPVLKLK